MTRQDKLWQQPPVAHRFLDGVRGAIPLAAEQIDVILRVIHAARDEVNTFLDLGCGDGVLGRTLFDQYPGAHGVLLDFSAPMLKAAQQKISEEPRVTVVETDYGLPQWVEHVQAYAPFDVIVSGFSIHHQPDARKREVYQEVYELLAPGGVFLNLEHVAPLTTWHETLFDEIMIDTMFAYHQQTGGTNTHAQIAEDHHSRPDKAANLLAPLDDQLAWLREIGFEQVDCFIKLFELALFGGIKPV